MNKIKIQNKNIDKNNISQLCSDRINDELGKKLLKNILIFLMTHSKMDKI